MNTGKQKEIRTKAINIMKLKIQRGISEEKHI